MLRCAKDIPVSERVLMTVSVQNSPTRGFIDVTKDCFAFDEEAGEAHCFVRNPESGRIETQRGKDGLEPKTRILKGKILVGRRKPNIIRLADQQPAA